MGKYDGEVIIGTGLDNSGIENDIAEIRGDLGGLKKVSDDLSKSLKTALSENGAEAGSAKIAKIRAQMEALGEEAGSLGAKLDGAKAKLAELQAQKEKVDSTLEPEGATYVNPDDYINAYAQKDDINKAVEDQQKLVSELQKEWDAVNDKLDAYRQKLDQANAAAEELPKSVDGTEKSIPSSPPSSPKGKQTTKENSSAQKSLATTQKNVGKLGKAVSHLGKRLSGILASALVFNVISAGLREMTAHLGQTLRTNKEFTAQTAKLRAALLTAFQPIYEFVVPALTFLVKILTSAVTAIASFFAALTGSTLNQAAASAEALYKESNALDSVGGAAKKSAKSLAAFDEINTLQADAGVGGGAVDPAYPDFTFTDNISPKLQKVIDKINEFIEPLKNLDFAPAKEAFQILGKSVASFGSMIGKHLEWYWFNVLVPLGEWTIEEFVPEAVKTLAVAFELLTSALDPVLRGLEKLWSVLQPIVKFIQKTVIRVFQQWQENAKEIAKVFEEKGPEIETIFENIGTILESVWKICEPILTGLRELFLDLSYAATKLAGTELGFLIDRLAAISTILAGFSSGNWDQVWTGMSALCETEAQRIENRVESLAGAVGVDFEELKKNIKKIAAEIGQFFLDAWALIKKIWSQVSIWFQENIVIPIQEVFAPLAEWFGELFESIKETADDAFYNIGVFAEGCWEVIQFCWDEVSNWFDENVIQPLSEAFAGLWAGLTQLATNAWEAICVLYDAAASWFDEHVAQPLSAVFSWLWESFLQLAEWAYSGAEKIFSGLCEFFKGILNGVISLLNSAISGIFARINNILSSLKNMSIGGFAPFANIRTISVPQIPYLAQGAVLPPNKPFMAVVGDQKHGTNIEAPLATIQEAVAMVMEDQTNAILAGFETSVGVQREILEAVLGIQIGDDVIGNAVARYNRKQAVMRGGAV